MRELAKGLAEKGFKFKSGACLQKGGRAEYLPSLFLNQSILEQSWHLSARSINQKFQNMASFVDLDRLISGDNGKQLQQAHTQQLQHHTKHKKNVQQPMSFLSPSLTPQGPNRPFNEAIEGTRNTHKSTVSHSGNVDIRIAMGPKASVGSSSEQRRSKGASNGIGTLANSFIHGRKVDSPKIFPGSQVSDERLKTSSAQQSRKKKQGAHQTGATKDGKKKISHQRKNATALNASQVVATSTTFQGKTLLNLGIQTNKEVDSRKFDFGLPPHSHKAPQHLQVTTGSGSATHGATHGGKKKSSIARTQNSKMHRHQRNFTTQQQPTTATSGGLQINNFFNEEGFARGSMREGNSTLEFEPVCNSGPASASVKNKTEHNRNISKSSKTVRERDGNARTQLKAAALQTGSTSHSQTNSNYQQQRKRQLSHHGPPKVLLSGATGSSSATAAVGGGVTLLNTTQVFSAKSNSLQGGVTSSKHRGSIGVPQTTKSLLVKPPIGNSNLTGKHKRPQMDKVTDQSRSYRSTVGGASTSSAHQQNSSAGGGHTRTKSADRNKGGSHQGSTKLKHGHVTSATKTTASKTDRTARVNLSSTVKGGTGTAASANFKNLSAHHLRESTNPIKSGPRSSFRASQPLMTGKPEIILQDAGLGKENLTANIVTMHQQAPRTMRQAAHRRSGEEGDFSLSSMSADSSHRANKSALIKPASKGGCRATDGDGLDRIFGKNYFVDGEQLLRHISPTQPRSPRCESSDQGANSSAQNCSNILNVTSLKARDVPQHLRLSQQLSSKRSKTTRGHRPQTSKQIHANQTSSSRGKHQRTLAADDAVNRTTLDSEINVAGSNRLMSGKTNKSQLDGQIASHHQPTFSVSGQERRERSQERPDRSKSKTRGTFGSKELASEAVSKSFVEKAKKHKISSLDKLIKKNIRQKGKQTAEEMLKKFMEEKQKKRKQAELQQMNEQIKKQNARETGHSVIKPFEQKKHRSRSCIQNRDNYFHRQNHSHQLHSGVVSPNLKQASGHSKGVGGHRDKSHETQHNNLNKTAILSSVNERGKRGLVTNAKDKSGVIELSILKKEVEDEVRRDRKKGIMQMKNPGMASANVSKAAMNMSAIVKSSSQKERSQNKTALHPQQQHRDAKKTGSNSTQAALNYTSLRRKDPELLFEQQNLTDGNFKARVARVIQEGKIEYNGGATPSSGLNTTKIQKFIEKQKKRNAAKTKMQATIEHEKILRVHENLTKLHNFTVNNRMKTSSHATTKAHQQPDLSSTLKREPARAPKKSGYYSVAGRDRSAKRKSTDGRLGNEHNFGMMREANLHSSFQAPESRGRPTRYNSNDSRKQSSKVSSREHRYQDPGETLHRDEDSNAYDRPSRGASSPQTRKLSDSRYSGSEARSPLTRSGATPANLSGSATAPLRVLKPKLAASGGKQQKRQQAPHDHHQNHLQLQNCDIRVRSIEQQERVEPANFSINHGLYASLDSEHAKRGLSSGAPADTGSKQFESIEPSQAIFVPHYQPQGPPNAFEASKKATPERRSLSPPFKVPHHLRALIVSHRLPHESEKQAFNRLNSAVFCLQRFARTVAELSRRRRQREDRRKPQIDDLALSQEMNSSDRRHLNVTGQSQRLKTSIPQLALHKVHSIDLQQKEESKQAAKAKKKTLLEVPGGKMSARGGMGNSARSNRSYREPESTSRSIFERNTFRQFMEAGHLPKAEDLKPEELPKMLQLREEAIAYQENATQKKINRELKSNKISPRTFQRKNLELEKWVTKEKQAVIKTKKKFEQEQQKAAKLLDYTKQNNEQIKAILNGENNYAQPIMSTSSRMHKAASNSSHNLNALAEGPTAQLTQSHRSRDGQSKPGVIDMIYERDHQPSLHSSHKSSNKGGRVRHSILDDVNIIGADREIGHLDSESAGNDSHERVNNQLAPSDNLRQNHHLASLKEAADKAQSDRSIGQTSNNSSAKRPRNLSSNSPTQPFHELDLISVQDPNTAQRQGAPQPIDMRDLRNLKINEKSEDTASLQVFTPQNQHPQWVGNSSSNDGGLLSKVTTPGEGAVGTFVDNNQSYDDKSMTRQYVGVGDSQHTPSLSQGTGNDNMYLGAGQFDSRKVSAPDTTHHHQQVLNTRRIDTSSSIKSGESAPDPAHLNKTTPTLSELQTPKGDARNLQPGGGLNRVVSYNKLEENVEDEVPSQESSRRQSEDKSTDAARQNQDLQPAAFENVINLDQAQRDLANKLFDEGSPNSVQSLTGADAIKNELGRGNFFLDNIVGQSGATSHDDLHSDPEQNIRQQLSHLNTEPLASPTMPNMIQGTTDTAGGAQKIKIEISGEPQQDQESSSQQHTFLPCMSPQNLQSPISADSAAMGIHKGSVSLSSSTSKDGSHQPMPHMGLPVAQQVLISGTEESSLMTGPDMTFGSGANKSTTDQSLVDPSVNLTSALQDSHDQNLSTLKKSQGGSLLVDDIDQTAKEKDPEAPAKAQAIKAEEQQNALAESSIEKQPALPGANLSPQMQAEGEALTNELLEYLLQDMSSEGLDHLINRQTRRQQEVRAQLRASCTGIKTDLFAIERYVDEVHQRIALDPEGFFHALYKPMTREALLVLNQLQNSEIGSCEHFDESYPQVLPLKLYLSLEKKRKAKREEEAKLKGEDRKVDGPQVVSPTTSVAGAKDQAAQNAAGAPAPGTPAAQNFDAECEHIHNKVLFDCINDSLLQFKPFGKEGQPLPWSRQNRRLKPTDDFNVGEIFEIVKHDCFRWAINLAGTLPRREFIYQGEFDEELFSEIREKKLVQLLAREMIESEPKWLNYEFEQAQVKIDVGDMILEQLVNETIGILNEQSQREFSPGDLAAALGFGQQE